LLIPIIEGLDRDLDAVDLGRQPLVTATKVLVNAPQRKWNADQQDNEVGDPAANAVANGG
jgi:hypothetical protein